MKIVSFFFATATTLASFLSTTSAQVAATPYTTPPGMLHSGPNIPGPGQKVANQSRGNIFYPVNFQTLLFAGHPIKAGQPFSAGDDWLKRLQVVVVNNSHKTLVAASIRIDFRELGRPYPLWTVELGRFPENGHNSTESSHQAIAVAPGDTVTLSLADKYESLKKFLEQRTQMSKVSACGIDLNVFDFSDGTRWMGSGNYSKANPDNPSQQIRISREEFNQLTLSEEPGSKN